MSPKDQKRFRSRLELLAARTRDTAAGLEQGARAGVGGDAGGSLSNAPLHLGDLGTETYNQELDATLLESEAFIRDEVTAALDRLDAGTYGTCEACGNDIPAERLDAIPYTRFCIADAAAGAVGPGANLNAGRPSRSAAAGLRPDPTDRLAAGTPGGGTAVGGLAGSNLGEGNPSTADLDAAAGSSRFDTAVDADDGDEGYAGSAGGAVGGTPAGKRVRGGRTGKGLAPQSDPTDKPTGQ